MERPDRNEKDDAQKAKLIFISLAVVVAIILIWSLVSANTARKERDGARLEAEMLKMDNTKLEQLLKDQNQRIDELTKKVQLCAAKPKAKSAKKAASKNTKKSSKSKKSR